MIRKKIIDENYFNGENFYGIRVVYLRIVD